MPLTAEQLAARKIGGSDVATILGLNPFKTPVELWLEKTGHTERQEDESLALKFGNIMEPAIAEMYTVRTSKRLRRCNVTLKHPKYEWLTAHIDRDVVGEERGVEIKNVGRNAAKYWGSEKDGRIAEYYLPQPHTYMLIKGYPVWDVAAYFGGDDLRIIPIEFDPEFAEMIVDATHDFWFNHVVADVPPPVDLDSPSALRALKKLYPGTNGQTIEGDPALLHWHRIAEEAGAKKNMYEKLVEGAKAHIAAAMGENSRLILPDDVVYERKEIKRKGYVVEDTAYMDLRSVKKKAAKSTTEEKVEA